MVVDQWPGSDQAQKEIHVRPFKKNMFEDELAEFYDLMRRYRNYDLECSFADGIIRSRCPNAKNVLDIFCGTGCDVKM